MSAREMLVECVPNFSDGRDPETLAAIVASIDAVDGAWVIDSSADRDHNRSVVTFVARTDAAVDAGSAALAVARDRIDLTQHVGVHPRMGATDVFPFVPLDAIVAPDALDDRRGADEAVCVDLAHRLGARAADLGIPVFYYGAAASGAVPVALPDVRVPFERLVALDAIAPDAGPTRPHETAGATAIGVRSFLIAFNVNLATDDVDVARRIARAIRASGGGLPGVRALGLGLREARAAQVSTNVCDYRRTGLCEVFEAIEAHARAEGVRVRESELVGLAPAAALDAQIAERVRLPDFDPTRHVLEDRIARIARPRR